MPKDSAGISDEATISLNDVGDLDAPDAKGPVDFYVQALEEGERVVDRWGNSVDAVPDDAYIERESYPGEHGGPVLPGDFPESEGEPE